MIPFAMRCNGQAKSDSFGRAQVDIDLYHCKRLHYSIFLFAVEKLDLGNTSQIAIHYDLHRVLLKNHEH